MATVPAIYNGVQLICFIVNLDKFQPQRTQNASSFTGNDGTSDWVNAAIRNDSVQSAVDL